MPISLILEAKMKNAHPLSPKLTVGPEPSREELEGLVADGFRAIISNRPDNEEGAVLSSDEMAAASGSLGVAYKHIPVEGRNPMEGSVRDFSEALEELDSPVYAFCKTGGRSAALWALSSVMEHGNDALIEKCADGNHDISMLAPKLDSRRLLLEDEYDD